MDNHKINQSIFFSIGFIFSSFLLGCSNFLDIEGTDFETSISSGNTGIYFPEVVSIPLGDVPRNVWDMIDEKGPGAYLESFNVGEAKSELLGDTCDSGESTQGPNPCDPTVRPLLETRVNEVIAASEVTRMEVAIILNGSEGYMDDIRPYLPLRLNLYPADPNNPKEILTGQSALVLELGEDTLVAEGSTVDLQSRDGFKGVKNTPAWSDKHVYVFDLQSRAEQFKQLLLYDGEVGLRANISIDSVPQKDLDVYLAFSAGMKFDFVPPPVGPLPPTVQSFDLVLVQETKDSMKIEFNIADDALAVLSEEGSDIVLYPRPLDTPLPLQGNPDLDDDIRKENEDIQKRNEKIVNMNQDISELQDKLNSCHLANLSAEFSELTIDSKVYEEVSNTEFRVTSGPQIDFVLFQEIVLKGFELIEGTESSFEPRLERTMCEGESDPNVKDCTGRPLEVVFNVYPSATSDEVLLKVRSGSPDIVELLRDSDQIRLFLNMNLNLKDSEGNLNITRNSSTGEAFDVDLNTKIVADIAGQVSLKCSNGG